LARELFYKNVKYENSLLFIPGGLFKSEIRSRSVFRSIRLGWNRADYALQLLLMKLNILLEGRFKELLLSLFGHKICATQLLGYCGLLASVFQGKVIL